MVWIHGGGLVVGESDGYDPTKLVAEDVIVVTINYRLGEPGFLAHPAFAAESPDGAAGNYGLLDQQAALRWVQRNIRAFGGDPKNVTIFGQSAGGLSVHSQLASPLAAGLFHKASVESGAYSLVQPSLKMAETAGAAFATSAGCVDPSTAAACLRSLTVEEILAQQPSGTMVPNLDGFVLPLTVGSAFTTGQFNQVPVIEGSNHDEWRLFVAQTEATTGTPLTAADYIPAIADTLRVPLPVAAAIADEYPLANYASPSVALGAVGTDRVFACNTRVSARLLSQYVPTYQYEFNDPNAPMLFSRRSASRRAPITPPSSSTSSTLERRQCQVPGSTPTKSSWPGRWSGTGRGSRVAVTPTRPKRRHGQPTGAVTSSNRCTRRRRRRATVSRPITNVPSGA
jgi:para-nitrobenzyl esterase